jgi:farnesyl diphosphate synthase
MDPEAPLPTTTEYVDYTVHTYNRIVKYKTAYYTYHVPLIMGLAVVGQLQTLPADKVEDLAVTMGEYFQVQDDFLDCYADPSVIGKIGTDIEDRKCSWLACTFLAHATAEQKATFKANYGEDDKAKVAVIKKLYLDAQVPKHFEAYEAAIVKKVDDLCAELEELNAGFVVAAKQLWGRTYKRSK